MITTGLSSSPSFFLSLCDQNACKHFQISVDMIKLCSVFHHKPHAILHINYDVDELFYNSYRCQHCDSCQMQHLCHLSDQSKSTVYTNEYTWFIDVYRPEAHTEGNRIENRKSNSKISETRNYYELHIFSNYYKHKDNILLMYYMVIALMTSLIT